MAEILNQTFLDAQTGTSPVTGDTLICTGLEYLQVQVIVVASAALSGTIDFVCGVEDAAVLPNTVLGAAISTPPAGFSYSAATGRLTLTAVANNTQQLLRFANPPKIFRPIYTHTGGGGTYRVRLIAWGFQKNTTP